MRLLLPAFPLSLVTALATCLVACPREDGPSKPAPGPSIEALIARAASDGYLSGEGAFLPAEPTFCCEAVVDCLALDAADALGTLALPPSPEQQRPDLDLYWMWGEGQPGLSRDFRLRADEALVFLGPSPPMASYVGFLAQVSTRAGEDGSRYRVQGALGPPLQVQTEGEGPLVVVLAPDKATDSRVRTWLAEVGYPLELVQSLPFSTELARLGLHDQADSFLISVQALDPADRQALASWWRDPATAILRFTPDGPEQPLQEPWPFRYFPLRGTGTDEAALEESVEALGVALFRHFLGWLPGPGAVTPRWRDPVRCLSDLDCDDTWPVRLRSESGALTLEERSIALVFGVNHTRTGKSTASSVSVIAGRSDAGVATFDHTQMVGSARPFLGDAPHVDDLYAVIFARDCAPLGEVPCLEVPETCPGPSLDGEMTLQFDDWLEPATGAAPLETELSRPRTLKLVPLGGGQ